MQSRTVLGRLMPPVAGAVALLTVGVTVAGILLMRSAVMETARLRTARLAPEARVELEEILRVGTHEGLGAFITRAGQRPDVAVVRLLRPDGEIEWSSRPGEVGQYARDHVQQRDARGDYVDGSHRFALWRSAIVHSAAPIRNGAECRTCHVTPASDTIGVLDLDVIVNPHLFGVTSFGSLILVLGLLYVAAVFAIVVPTVNSLVVRPMRNLVGAFQRVERGDLWVSAASSGTVELDGVVQGFNQMVERLRQAQLSEQEAHRLQMERVEQLAAVGQLAAGLAHEFRNPLSSVKAVLEVLGQDPDLGETRRTVLRDAAGELDRIDQIVKDLLQYARPRVPSIAPFDLNTLVKTSADLALARAVSKGLQVHFDLDSTLPQVVADEDMIRQVVVNLLLNAEQATASLSGPSIVLSTGVAGGFAWCRVRDNGQGVPRDRARSIFDPFMTTKRRGTGLGLSISRRLVELQGGRLVLDNPGEPGAAFRFLLPIEQDHVS